MYKSFDNLDLTTKFVESWRNLNPHRNKVVAGPLLSKPLAESTKRAELARLRTFFKFCGDRLWIGTNQAKKIRFRTRIRKKFGLEPEEELRGFTATKQVVDGHGRVGQYNALENLPAS